VIELARLLLDGPLPDGVSRERGEHELYERKVAVFEQMLAEGTPTPRWRPSSPKPARAWPSSPQATPVKRRRGEPPAARRNPAALTGAPTRWR
jgi:hypothetical protein